MRLFIFSPFYPPHIGGLETHALEFNRHIAPAVEKITVFTPRLPENGVVHETDNTIEVFRFPAFEAIHNYPIPKFWLPEFWSLWQKATKNEPTHVISRTRFFFTSLMAWRFARTQRLPWLHIEHGSDFVHFHSALKSFIGRTYDRIFGRFVLRQADRVVANSEASSAFVKRLSGRDDCQTIYRGVEIDAIENASERDEIRKRFPDRIVVGYLGRLIDGKGVIHILEALTTIRDERLAVAIIGSGPERGRLEAYVREHSLEDSVFFLGHRPLPEAIGLMKSFDIFVNPSYSEGIPTSVIEASLLGKAIIATDVGGTSEIITGDGDGFLIRPGQSDRLAEKLRLLANDTGLRRAIAEKARECVRNKFSWERATSQYLSLLETLPQKSK